MGIARDGQEFIDRVAKATRVVDEAEKISAIVDV
jgi:hypothetical protein